MQSELERDQPFASVVARDDKFDVYEVHRLCTIHLSNRLDGRRVIQTPFVA